MQNFKLLGTISLVFAVVTVLGCGGSDHPADVLTELPVDDASDTLEPPADSDTDIDYDTGTDADTDTDADEVCTPSCGERVCGPDPVCEQSCGQCPDGKTCNSEGQCVAEGCVPACGERKCGLDPVCGTSCGECEAHQKCNADGRCECDPACGPRQCGLDPVCGTSCGECEAHEKCNADGQCECVPACSPRQCGPDPVCGTSCGECEAHEKCNDDGQCECDPACGPRQCGPDPVCGTSCGECEAHEKCNDDGQCIPNDTGIEWVRIAGGTFEMGSNDGESDERPVHSVTVPTFEMTRTEVTVDQYGACVDAGFCTAPDTGTNCNWDKSDRGSHPINCVDWDQAQDFANWLAARLPSEAEWEYAARSGGQGWKYPWGDEEATCDRAVIEDDSGSGCGSGSTWPVCSKPSGNTTQGLCDMAGNVWEWVQDWHHGNYDGAPTDGSAWESPTGSYRVFRGGSWHGDARYVRAAIRGNDDPGARSVYLGFRVARSVR
ncbi:MAG: Serine/threonine-protein kinase pkn1 [Deltaproteobacteria bacterium ADurb.Bin058]|nr:MAG: Serine/threonine-protein kinase pkn1 [Deltaproteobacteria bacterium ADurb.Bin058]